MMGGRKLGNERLRGRSAASPRLIIRAFLGSKVGPIGDRAGFG